MFYGIVMDVFHDFGETICDIAVSRTVKGKSGNLGAISIPVVIPKKLYQKAGPITPGMFIHVQGSVDEYGIGGIAIIDATEIVIMKR